MKSAENMLLHKAGGKSGISDRANFDDAAIGVMALISMYQAVTFLLLQILVMIPMTIILLISESQGWNKKAEEILLAVLWGLIELVLIIILARKGKKRFVQYMRIRQEQENRGELPENSRVRHTSAVTETQLEISLVVAAMVGIAWALFIGIQIRSLHIVLTIVEGAALLFLSIFIIIRFLTTQKIRPVALLSLFLTAFSLWRLLH